MTKYDLDKFYPFPPTNVYKFVAEFNYGIDIEIEEIYVVAKDLREAYDKFFNVKDDQDKFFQHNVNITSITTYLRGAVI